MNSEIKQFLTERRYVQNSAENTLEFYKYSLRAFVRTVGNIDVKELNRTVLKEFITEYRKAGKSPECTDARIRGINPFLAWLFENNLIDQPLRIERLKLKKRVMKTFSETEMRTIIGYKPKDKYEKRLYVLLLTLADTGIRINEALTLTKNNLDFDNLLLSVSGKGDKERVVPFSIQLRKHLYRHCQSHDFDFVFCSYRGTKLMYNNMRRDFNNLMVKLQIETDGSFHAFRRYFATNYIRQSGNPLVLQRLLGHSTLRQTNEYVKMVTDDLSKEINRTSVLSRFS